MNRQQRRAAPKRKHEIGVPIWTQVLRIDGQWYWYETSDNSSAPLPGRTLHGPFKTETELNEHQRLTLMGPQCKVTEGGAWDPAWDKPQ
jgi:hypothetical protein